MAYCTPAGYRLHNYIDILYRHKSLTPGGRFARCARGYTVDEAAEIDAFGGIRYYLSVPTIKKGAIPMTPMMLLLVVLLAVVVIGLLLVIALVGMYNRLVTLRNRYKNAYSQIDVQLKRRYDLIPNLVEVAKGYIKHERETLEAVTKARNIAYAAGQQAAKNPGDPVAMTALGGAEGQLAGALGRLFAVVEAYPDLKANQNMLALQEDSPPRRTRSPLPGKPTTTR